MLVAIHQPCFVPWLGYLDRMLRSDLFVILDHVQFERRNYQNRALIRLEDESKWLTIPVVQLSQKEKIIDKMVDNPADLSGTRWWGPNHFNTLKYAYRKAPYFYDYAPPLREVLEIKTPMMRSSELCVEGQKSGLLLAVCQKVGASAFLGGMGGSREYLDKEAFAAANMGVKWQDFSHPAYPQCGTAPFMKGLSTLDLLFNCGPRAAEIARQAKATDDERLAA